MKRAGRISIAAAASLLALALAATSIWEGTAAVSAYGEFPASGYYAACNAFPRNTVIEVKNLENGKTLQVIVAKELDNPGLFIALSPEAAAALGVERDSVARVRVSMPRSSLSLVPEIDSGVKPTDLDLEPSALAATGPASAATAAETAAASGKTATPAEAAVVTPSAADAGIAKLPEVTGLVSAKPSAAAKTSPAIDPAAVPLVPAPQAATAVPATPGTPTLPGESVPSGVPSDVAAAPVDDGKLKTFSDEGVKAPAAKTAGLVPLVEPVRESPEYIALEPAKEGAVSLKPLEGAELALPAVAGKEMPGASTPGTATDATVTLPKPDTPSVDDLALGRPAAPSTGAELAEASYSGDYVEKPLIYDGGVLEKPGSAAIPVPEDLASYDSTPSGAPEALALEGSIPGGKNASEAALVDPEVEAGGTGTAEASYDMIPKSGSGDSLLSLEPSEPRPPEDITDTAEVVEALAAKPEEGLVALEAGDDPAIDGSGSAAEVVEAGMSKPSETAGALAAADEPSVLEETGKADVAEAGLKGPAEAESAELALADPSLKAEEPAVAATPAKEVPPGPFPSESAVAASATRPLALSELDMAALEGESSLLEGSASLAKAPPGRERPNPALPIAEYDTGPSAAELAAAEKAMAERAAAERAAAEALALAAAGPKAPAETVKPVVLVPYGVTPTMEAGKHYIQVGAYGKKESADRFVAMMGLEYPIMIVEIRNKSGTLYKVFLGPLEYTESGAALLRCRALGYRDAFLVKTK